MAERSHDVPRNKMGITDQAQLDDVVGKLAARQLYVLERDEPLTEFTRESLCQVHETLMGDAYPWAGQLRNEEVGAMGIPMCRSQYVDNELDRVMKAIDRRPPSPDDREQAIATVADHWSELTMVHPFRDGNSRTQRFFFDQMFRSAGWAVDWSAVDVDAVHAARYVGAVTVDPSYLAQMLDPGVKPAEEVDAHSLSATGGHEGAHSSAEVFHDMMSYRQQHRGQPYVFPEDRTGPADELAAAMEFGEDATEGVDVGEALGAENGRAAGEDVDLGAEANPGHSSSRGMEL